MILSSSSELATRLQACLLGPEGGYLAFMLADVRPGDTRELRFVDVYAVPAEELDLATGLHVALKDEARAKVIKWAWDRDLALLEAHVHLGARPPMFSPTDLDGLAEFVPHVWWRLRGRPYAAMVWSRGGFDALAWIHDPTVADPVISFAVDDQEPASPSGLSLASFNRRPAADG